MRALQNVRLSHAGAAPNLCRTGRALRSARQNPLGAGFGPPIFLAGRGDERRGEAARSTRFAGSAATGRSWRATVKPRRRRLCDNPSVNVRELFPTQVYAASLGGRGAQRLNARLLQEARQLELDDEAGRRWSASNYPGGYTSYGSASRMHRASPTFAELERRLKRHVRAFASALGLDLAGRPLAMTDCWVNLMRRGVVHGLHLHPMSTISGTYYVATPAGAPGIKLEDPRLDRMMAAPPRGRGRRGAGPWVVLPARAGHLVLFESWLRHEVPANAARSPRVSVSFNYSWF
ncbi:MAG: hypothetical protein JSR73_06430 [Proteobacteria bacterium]|nr:hypothetical protein [Pseudomonadota bacterium]